MMGAAKTGASFKGFGFGGKTSYSDANIKVALQRLPVDEMVSHAHSLSESDIVDFGTGDSVQLKFDLGSQKSIEGRLRKQIESVMEEGGVKIVDKSDFVLEMKFSTGPTENKTYQIIGGLEQRTRDVSFTPKSCSAKLLYQGHAIWSSGRSSNLGRPFSEDDLDQTISDSNSLTSSVLLDFDYPNKVRAIDPRKRKEFRWQE